MSGFQIGAKRVGDGAPCFIVAEVAQAHEGSLRIAHDFIDAVATTGADAVKFQCHIAEAESTPEESWRVEPVWKQDASRYAYWKRMEFSPEQWVGLKEHANARGLIFLCSPFSVEAVKLLDPLVPAWKVASGEVTNKPLLYAVHNTVKPVILSYGMATPNEFFLARDIFAHSPVRIPLAVLQCTSMYPCPPEKIGLDFFHENHDWPVGLSDHSGAIWPSLAAATLGASIVEVHVKLSHHDSGFDSSASITPEDLCGLVKGVRLIEKATQTVNKYELAAELEPMRRLFLDKHKRKAAYYGPER